MSDPAYRRVIVKLSGESLTGAKEFGIDQPTVERLSGDLVAAAKLGVELGVVVGGGNIFRGVEVSKRGVERPVGDTMGMLATVMNCLVLERRSSGPDTRRARSRRWPCRRCARPITASAP
jgi:uridylate kinase